MLSPAGTACARTAITHGHGCDIDLAPSAQHRQFGQTDQHGPYSQADQFRPRDQAEGVHTNKQRLCLHQKTQSGREHSISYEMKHTSLGVLLYDRCSRESLQRKQPTHPLAETASNKHGSQSETCTRPNPQHRPTAKPRVSTGGWRRGPPSTGDAIEDLRASAPTRFHYHIGRSPLCCQPTGQPAAALPSHGEMRRALYMPTRVHERANSCAGAGRKPIRQPRANTWRGELRCIRCRC